MDYKSRDDNDRSDDHDHDATKGVNAIASQFYTPEIVCLIHEAIFKHFYETPLLTYPFVC